jgi:hypothetical protein
MRFLFVGRNVAHQQKLYCQQISCSSFTYGVSNHSTSKLKFQQALCWYFDICHLDTCSLICLKFENCENQSMISLNFRVKVLLAPARIWVLYIPHVCRSCYYVAVVYGQLIWCWEFRSAVRTFILFTIFTAKCFKLCGVNLWSTCRDETLKCSELTVKLEPAFLAGLRCVQPTIRAKFFEVFDASMKRRLHDRLMYITCSQNWEPMGPHYWIKQCIELLVVTASSSKIFCYWKGSTVHCNWSLYKSHLWAHVSICVLCFQTLFASVLVSAGASSVCSVFGGEWGYLSQPRFGCFKFAGSTGLVVTPAPWGVTKLLFQKLSTQLLGMCTCWQRIEQ